MQRVVSVLTSRLRVASTLETKIKVSPAAWLKSGSAGNLTAPIPFVQSQDVGWSKSVGAARHAYFSTKSSNPEPSSRADRSSKTTLESLQSSSESLSSKTLASTLSSSEGVSQSLTGPRITSKKGYLDRENMIRETQKAIRQYYKEGAYQDALEVTYRLVDQVDDHFGRAHGVYASALSDMALMMKTLGRYKDATETYLKALEVYRAVYKGEENASFASTLHNLGMAFRAMAEESTKLEKIPLMERAAEAFERCVQIRDKVLTNNHPDLQLARSRLAITQGMLGGEKERTEARLRAALDGLQMAVGNKDASTANAMTNLALFLKGQGQHEESTQLYSTVLETRTELYGPNHFDVLVSMHNLSMVHYVAGRKDEAVRLQEEIAKIGEEMGVTEEDSSGDGEAGGENLEKGIKVSKEKGKGLGKNKKDQGNQEKSTTTWKPAR